MPFCALPEIIIIHSFVVAICHRNHLHTVFVSTLKAFVRSFHAMHAFNQRKAERAGIYFSNRKKEDKTITYSIVCFTLFFFRLFLVVAAGCQLLWFVLSLRWTIFTAYAAVHRLQTPCLHRHTFLVFFFLKCTLGRRDPANEYHIKYMWTMSTNSCIQLHACDAFTCDACDSMHAPNKQLNSLFWLRRFAAFFFSHPLLHRVVDVFSPFGIYLLRGNMRIWASHACSPRKMTLKYEKTTNPKWMMRRENQKKNKKKTKIQSCRKWVVSRSNYTAYFIFTPRSGQS